MCPDDIARGLFDANVPDPDTSCDPDDYMIEEDQLYGTPCLICGDTVPGPHPGLLCPDCAAATGPTG